MQPYQSASEEFQRQTAQAPKIAKTLGSVALAASGVAGGAAVLNKIAPFFNKYIPQDLAIKGISKVSPTIGKFINTSINQGFDKDEVFDFVKNKFNGENEEGKQKDPLELIAGYSPHLSQFIKDYMDKGRSLKDTVDILKMGGAYDKDIKKIESDTKEDFGEFLQRLFANFNPQGQQQGNPQQPQQQPQSPQQPQQPNSATGQQQNQQIGPGQQRLMQLLQQRQRK